MVRVILEAPATEWRSCLLLREEVRPSRTDSRVLRPASFVSYWRARTFFSHLRAHDPPDRRFLSHLEDGSGRFQASEEASWTHETRRASLYSRITHLPDVLRHFVPMPPRGAGHGRALEYPRPWPVRMT